MRVEKLLNIMEAFLDALKYEQMCEAFGWEDPIDFMCDDSDDEEDWEETDWEEEREEITETVKDNSPRTLKEENEHLKDLVDRICEIFGLDKYETNWKLWVAWEAGLLEEIAKARKKLKK
jgi:hypothetical protein